MKNPSPTPFSPREGIKNLLGMGHYLLLLGLGLEVLTLFLRRWISFPIRPSLGLQIALTVPCLLTCLAGVAWFNLSFRPAKLLEGDKELVTHGPYGYVRHPLYSVLMLSLPPLLIIWLEDLLFIAPWVLTVLLSHYVVRLEERGLVRRFGTDYSAYRQYVPALLPLKGNGGRRYRQAHSHPDPPPP